MTITLKEGDVAPDFTLKDQKGEKVSLSSEKGRRIVVAFIQQEYIDAHIKSLALLTNEFKKKQISLYLISSEVVVQNESPFQILADNGHDICALYGVWGKKVIEEKTVQAMTPATFLLDEDNRITGVLLETDAATHAQKILAALGGR